MINKEYYISVGEPWDFESFDGKNIIKGTILTIRTNKCIIFKSNHCLEVGKVKGNFLILVPRYEDSDFSSLEKNSVVINGYILKKFNEHFSEKELHENSQFVIIGSINENSNGI